MFVGDVYPLRSAAASDSGRLSAGRPVCSSVMATSERQVSAAQRCTVRVLHAWWWSAPRTNAGAAERVPARAGRRRRGRDDEPAEGDGAADEELAPGGRRGGGVSWGHRKVSSGWGSGPDGPRVT